MDDADDLIRRAAEHGLFDGTDSIAPARPEPPTPEVVAGRYELVDEIGRGGFGSVWRARDRTLGRDVALKLLKINEPEEVARFELEARVAAKLRHAHVVSVHDVGTHDGRPYLVMDLIDGKPMSALIATLGADRLGRILAKAARGLGAAHAAGVVHRDVKPGNILVDAGGEPFVTDFGLAKPLAGDSGVKTVTGAIMGTPMYMAPEQAAGELQRISPRSDVFSLGVVLYEILTKRNPFLAHNVHQILERVQTYDPPPPSRRGKRVPVELDWVCLKALEKDPARRYADANGFAEDLERFYRGENVTARPASLMYRAAKRVRRNPWAWGMGAAAVALIAVAAIAGGKWKQSEEDLLRARLETALRRAERDIAVIDLEMATREQDVLPLLAKLDPLIEELRATLRKLEDPEGFSTLGQLLRKQGLLDEAEAALTHSRSQDPSATRTHYELALIYLTRLRESQTRRAVSSNSDLDDELLRIELPWIIEAGAAMGRAGDPSGLRGALDAIAAGDMDRAASLLRAAATAGRLDAQGLKLAGDIAIAAWDWAHALEFYREAHARARCDWESLIVLARIELYRAGEMSLKGEDPKEALNAAIEWLNRCESVKRDEALCFSLRASVRMRRAGALEASGLDPSSELQAAHLDVDRGLRAAGFAGSLYSTRSNLLSIEAGWLERTGGDAQAAWEAALEAASRAIEQAPDQAVAYLNRSKYYLSLAEGAVWRAQDPEERYSRALDDADRAIELNRKSVQGHVARGEVLRHRAMSEEARGRDPGASFEAAVAALDEAVNASPSNAHALVERGAALLYFGRHLDDTGRDPSTMYERAMRDLSEALSVKRDLLHAWTLRGSLRAYLAEWMAENGKDPLPGYRDALKDLELAIGGGIPDPQTLNIKGITHKRLAEALAQRGSDPIPELRNAEACLTRAMEGMLSDPNPILNLATIHFDVGERLARTGEDPLSRYEKALSLFDRALTLQPSNNAALHNRGLTWLSIGQTRDRRGEDPSEAIQNAIADFSSVLALKRDDSTAHYNRGNGYFDLAVWDRVCGRDPRPNFRKSMQDYGAAMETDRDSSSAYIGRAGAAFELGLCAIEDREDPKALFDAALADYDRAIVIKPDNFYARNGQGRVHLERGNLVRKQGGDPLDDYERAANCYSASLRINAGNLPSLNGRGIAYMETALHLRDVGRDSSPAFKGAIMDFESALKGNPNYWQANLNLANALYEWGVAQGGAESVEGVRLLERAFAQYETCIRIRPSAYAESMINRIRDLLGTPEDR